MAININCGNIVSWISTKILVLEYLQIMTTKSENNTTPKNRGDNYLTKNCNNSYYRHETFIATKRKMLQYLQIRVRIYLFEVLFGGMIRVL